MRRAPRLKISTFLGIYFYFTSAHAQTADANCQSGYGWLFNNIQQSPCLVAAFLGHQCATSSPFNVPSLSSGQEYLPPTDQQANQCECSTIYYSLLGACAACQGSSIGTFSSWTVKCPESSISIQTYPLATPNGTQIPTWAYLPLNNDAFDFGAVGRNVTGNPNFGQKPAALSVGAIVGLSIGGAIALCLIVVAIILFIRLRRQGHRYMEPLNSTPEQHGVRHSKIEGPPRKLFNPFSSATRVVSYRPGLNFDLVQNRTGDLVELSESKKKITKSRPSQSGRSNQSDPSDPSSQSSGTGGPSGSTTGLIRHGFGGHSESSTPSGSGFGSGFFSRTSLESSNKRNKKERRSDQPKIGPDAQAGPSITSFFSRAKEVKPQEANIRIDLAEDDASSSMTDNPPSNHPSRPHSQQQQHLQPSYPYPPAYPQYDPPSAAPGIRTINPAHHSDRPALLD